MICSADDVLVFAYPDETGPALCKTLEERLGQHPGVHLASLWLPTGPSVATLSARLHEQLSELPWYAHLHLLGLGSAGVVVRHYAQTHGDDRLVQTLSVGTPFAVDEDRSAGVAQTGSWTVLTELALGARRALAVPHLSVVASGDPRTDTLARRQALSARDIALIRNCTTEELPLRSATARIIVDRVLAHSASYALRSA